MADESLDSNRQQAPVPNNREVQRIRLATLNFRDGHNAWINQTVQCIDQMNIDVAILTEVKFSDGRYMWRCSGWQWDYQVVATKLEKHKGGVVLVHCNQDGWSLESMTTFGPNVIRTTLVSGQDRKYLIGAYVPPSEEDGSTLDHIREAWATVRNPRWPVIMMGDFNVDLHDPQ